MTVKRLLAGVAILMFLWAASVGSTAGAGDKADALPAPLHLVPVDAAGFVHVRLADLWSAPAFSDLRYLLAKAGPEALQVFEQKYVPGPSSVASLTLVHPTAESLDTPLFSHDPQAASPLLIMTTIRALELGRLEKALGNEARRKTHGKHSYFLLTDTTGTVLHVVDERNVILGSEKPLLAWLGRSGRNPLEGPLQAALLAAKGKHHVVAGLNPAVLPRERFGSLRQADKVFSTIGASAKLVDQSWPAFLQPLLTARCVTLALDVDKDLHGELRIDFASEALAAAGKTGARAGLDAATSALTPHIQGLERDLRDGPKFSGFGNKPQPHGPRALANHTGQAMEDFVVLVQLGMFRGLQQEMKALAIEQQGKSIRLKASLPMNANAMFLALSAITALGQSANSTFSSVGEAIGTQDKPATPREEPKAAPKALEVPPGMRAVAVHVLTIPDPANLPSLPGSRVDVVVTIRKPDESFAKVLLENVLVLAVDTFVRKEGTEALPGNVVTLALTPEDAVRIATARDLGPLSLVRRRTTDADDGNRRSRER